MEAWRLGYDPAPSQGDSIATGASGQFQMFGLADNDAGIFQHIACLDEDAAPVDMFHLTLLLLGVQSTVQCLYKWSDICLTTSELRSGKTQI